MLPAQEDEIIAPLGAYYHVKNIIKGNCAQSMKSLYCPLLPVLGVCTQMPSLLKFLSWLLMTSSQRFPLANSRQTLDLVTRKYKFLMVKCSCNLLYYEIFKSIEIHGIRLYLIVINFQSKTWGTIQMNCFGWCGLNVRATCFATNFFKSIVIHGMRCPE